VHPPTPVLKPELTADGWERVGWTVDAEVDGTMVDRATGLEVAYLFWEGQWSYLTDMGFADRSAEYVMTYSWDLCQY